MNKLSIGEKKLKNKETYNHKQAERQKINRDKVCTITSNVDLDPQNLMNADTDPQILMNADQDPDPGQ